MTVAMMIRHYLVVLCLFYYVSTCYGILVHGPSNSSHPYGIASHETSTDYSSLQQKFEQEVAKLSAKLFSLEHNNTEIQFLKAQQNESVVKLSNLEKENLDLKTLVKHLNRSFMLQQYESRMLAIQLASVESNLRALNNASNKTSNDVSNLSNITLDIRQTLLKNDEEDKNTTGRLNEIERVMSKTNNDVSNLYNITLDIRQTLAENYEQDQNSTRRQNEMERAINNDVSNLYNITLDIRQTLVENNEQDQNSTRRLNKMERSVNETIGDVSNLYNITSDIRQSMNKDKEEDKNSTRRLNEIERVMNYLKAQLRSSAVSSIDMERKSDEMNSSMMLLNSTVLNLQKDYSIKVAFTAGMTSSSDTFSGGTLVFPAVITNIGGGYNPSTGVFTAPNQGLYVFYVSGIEYDSHDLGLDIVLNGVSKVRLVGSNRAPYQTGTNMAVLDLQHDDRVWVKHSEGTGYYSLRVLITTFSGFQIHV